MILDEGRADPSSSQPKRSGRRGRQIRGWAILALSLGYVGLLFAVAYVGDRLAKARGRAKAKPVIYALSLAVYCTSWTFYGSVGLAAKTGYDFLTIYLGPILMFTLGWPLLGRVIRISKSHNITSIADFIAARYGKSQMLAAAVTVIATLGTLPYIALQLKAVSASFTVLLGYPAVTLCPRRASRPRPIRRLPWRCSCRCSRSCSEPAISTPPSTTKA